MIDFTINDIVRISGGELHGAAEGGTPVAGAVIDSRAAGEGIMFCALKGERVDGHD